MIHALELFDENLKTDIIKIFNMKLPIHLKLTRTVTNDPIFVLATVQNGENWKFGVSAKWSSLPQPFWRACVFQKAQDSITFSKFCILT